MSHSTCQACPLSWLGFLLLWGGKGLIHFTTLKANVLTEESQDRN